MKKTKNDWCDTIIAPVVDKINPHFFPKRLEELKNKKPKIILMNSMSDISTWDQKYLEETISVMYKNQQHDYIFLSKKYKVAYERFQKAIETVFDSDFFCCKYLLGATICTGKNLKELFLHEKCVPDFISFEPLHENLKLSTLSESEKEFLLRIGWIIIGAETGNNVKKIKPEVDWIYDIISFFKNKPIFMKKNLSQVLGKKKIIQQYPVFLNRH